MQIVNQAAKVREFMKKFGQALDVDIFEREKDGSGPSVDVSALLDLRQGLIREEFAELHNACEDFLYHGFRKETQEQEAAAVEIVDALTDILYVTYGFFHVFGWDSDRAFDIVHDSNMSKLGKDGKPIYREDGKVLKGPDYRAPDLRRIVIGE